MEVNFCRRCGSPLSKKLAHAYLCEKGHTIFANPAPAAGLFFINDKNEVLLSVRGINPHKGMLDAFGGFIDGAETLEESLKREMKEELGLDPKDYDTPQYLTSAIGLYDFGGEIFPVLSSMFWSRIHPGSIPKPSDDVADIVTLPLHDIDLQLLHDQDIRLGMRALQRKFPKLVD